MNRITTTTARLGRLQAAAAAALVGAIALSSTAWMSWTGPSDETPVVQLERVVIHGHRADRPVAEVKQLPRVVIVGKRDPGADGVQVASAR
ncbi:hypothetical protein [Roseateles sp. BYS96W]|uniref:Uncharacterized protein n=1 Tax=Pelomonas nitida TaxID=3299027 RepID=A0ABW7GBH6_9BURK